MSPKTVINPDVPPGTAEALNAVPAAADAPPPISKLVSDLNRIMKDEFTVQSFDPGRLVLASATHGDTLELAVHSPHLEASVLNQLAMDAFKLRLRTVRGLGRR